MKADITFANVAFSNILSGQFMRVRLGEQFEVLLQDVGAAPIQWATTNDPALEVRLPPGEPLAVVKTTSAGTSEIQVQNVSDRKVVMYLTVEVFDVQAASLNVSAGTPELK